MDETPRYNSNCYFDNLSYILLKVNNFAKGKYLGHTLGGGQLILCVHRRFRYNAGAVSKIQSKRTSLTPEPDPCHDSYRVTACRLAMAARQ